MPTWDQAAQILMALAIIANVILQIRQGRKLEVIHKATNSLTDRLVATTRADATKDGIETERARQKIADFDKEQRG